MVLSGNSCNKEAPQHTFHLVFSPNTAPPYQRLRIYFDTKGWLTSSGQHTRSHPPLRISVELLVVETTFWDPNSFSTTKRSMEMLGRSWLGVAAPKVCFKGFAGTTKHVGLQKKNGTPRVFPHNSIGVPPTRLKTKTQTSRLDLSSAPARWKRDSRTRSSGRIYL